MSSVADQDAISKELRELKKQYVVKALNVARNVLDLPVIIYFMGHGFRATQAGLLGTMSSAISLYNMWGQK